MRLLPDPDDSFTATIYFHSDHADELITVSLNEAINLVCENLFSEESFLGLICMPKIQFAMGHYVDPEGPPVHGFKCRFSSPRTAELLTSKGLQFDIKDIKKIII